MRDVRECLIFVDKPVAFVEKSAGLFLWKTFFEALRPSSRVLDKLCDFKQIAALRRSKHTRGTQ